MYINMHIYSVQCIYIIRMYILYIDIYVYIYICVYIYIPCMYIYIYIYLDHFQLEKYDLYFSFCRDISPSHTHVNVHVLKCYRYHHMIHGTHTCVPCSVSYKWCMASAGSMASMHQRAFSLLKPPCL